MRCVVNLEHSCLHWGQVNLLWESKVKKLLFFFVQWIFFCFCKLSFHNYSNSLNLHAQMILKHFFWKLYQENLIKKKVHKNFIFGSQFTKTKKTETLKKIFYSCNQRFTQSVWKTWPHGVTLQWSDNSISSEQIGQEICIFIVFILHLVDENIFQLNE